MTAWQDLAGILNYLLTTESSSLVATLLMVIGFGILIWQGSVLKNRLGNVETELVGVKTELGDVKGRLTNVEGRLGSVEGRLTNVEGQVVTLQTQFREHELQCGERWGQVQRDLGAIRSSGGTADKSGQD